MINEQRLKWGSRVTYCTIMDRHVTVHGTVEAGETKKKCMLLLRKLIGQLAQSLQQVGKRNADHEKRG